MMPAAYVAHQPVPLVTAAARRRGAPLMCAVDGGNPALDGWGTVRSKVVSWYDPATFGVLGAGLSGRDLLQAILDGRLPPPPMIALIGAEVISVGEGEVTFRCMPDESTYNPLGMIHGGLLCTLLDTAAGTAVQTRLPSGAAYASIEIKVSFLKPLRADNRGIDVRGRALRVGTRVAFAEAHARDRSGELVGHATTSLAISRR
jgi:uncharacterized protein (TIGR00369 family)